MRQDDAGRIPRYLLTIYPEADRGFAGFYQQVFREERVPFAGIAQLLLSIDEEIRASGGSLAAERAEGEALWERGRPRTGRRRQDVQPVRIPRETGSVNHFLITVRFCRNATWQGEVHWREKHLRRDFRSCLELTRMIEDAAGGRKRQEGAGVRKHDKAGR